MFINYDLSPWGMYLAADAVVKSVMILLVLASLSTWAVCLFKSIELVRRRRKAAALLRHLIQTSSFSALDQGSQEQFGDAWLMLQASRHELALSSQGPVTDAGIKERVGARIERVQASLIAKMNRGTGLLASIGSVAPFVGLFGTVWGIMNSFIGIAQAQTTNLAVVAPGIAEALLATAMGLIAAIPAVMMYNYFARAIGGYRALLADTVTAILTIISRDLDRHHPDARRLVIAQESDGESVVPLVREAH